MTKKKLEADVDATLLDLAQSAADAQGVTLASLLERGETLPGLAQNQASQAAWRLFHAGKYPAEIVEEAKAEAARQTAARTAGAQA